MGYELCQKQFLDTAWEKGYLNTIQHYEMLSDFTRLSRKQISDYRRKRSLKSGFPTPKPKQPHVPKKFDDMCRTFLKSAWRLGYLPGKKHYGMLADFSGLSRKQISDWSRKYSIKLGLKRNRKRRIAPLVRITNMAKRRRFDEKPIIPKMSVKMEYEDHYDLAAAADEYDSAAASNGRTPFSLEDPDFSLKPDIPHFSLKSDRLFSTLSGNDPAPLPYSLSKPHSNPFMNFKRNEEYGDDIFKNLDLYAPSILNVNAPPSYSHLSTLDKLPLPPPSLSPQGEWDQFEAGRSGRCSAQSESFHDDWKPSNSCQFCLTKPSEDDLWMPPVDDQDRYFSSLGF